MTITPEDITKLGKLAHIKLSDPEISIYTKQIDEILSHVAELEKVADSTISVQASTAVTANKWRDDVITPGLTAEIATAAAPAKEANQFLVPKIVTTMEAEE